MRLNNNAIPLDSLTGLQNQYTGYSINLAGGRITLLAMAFPPLTLPYDITHS